MDARNPPSADSRLAAMRIEADYLSKLLYGRNPPPSCPKCSKHLDIIHVTRYPGLWEWNEDKRAYAVAVLNPAEEYVCNRCRQVIGGRYANGNKWGFQPRLV